MNTNLKKALLTELAALGIVMLVLGSATTWAADMCFLNRNFGDVTVGKNFSFPDPQACKAFNGYYLSGNNDCLVSGEACGTNFGEIRFNLTASCPSGTNGMTSFHIDRLNADLDRAGSGYLCVLDRSSGLTSCSSYENKRIPCPPHSLN